METKQKRTYRSFRYWKKRNCKKGENNPVAKITKSIPDYIRAEFHPKDRPVKLLASKLGLSAGHVRAILRGQYWSDGRARNLAAETRLTPQQEEAIIQLYNSTVNLRQRHPEKWSHRRLAKAFHCSKGLIVYVLSGKKRSVKLLILG